MNIKVNNDLLEVEDLEEAELVADKAAVEAADLSTSPTFDPPSVELPDFKDKTLDELNEWNQESPTCFLTGVAGSGKTYLVRQHNQRDPQFGILCATTGVAGINLGPGVPTIHSLLGFGNTQGAEDSYNSGNMMRKLRMIADQGFRWVVLDEASMLHYKVLDYIMLAMDDYNNTYSGKQPLGLLLTGDMCQLPPVPDKLIGEGGKYVLSKSGKEVSEPTPWLFKAECWSRFENHQVKLTEVKRQSDPEFINALNLARVGKGRECVELLKKAGVQFKTLLNPSFDGTTIVATNAEVDRFNASSLLKVQGESFEIASTRWCAKQYPPSEWKNVPDRAKLKIGALVMILQNDQGGQGIPKRYVNGDLGHIKGFHRGFGEGNPEIEAVDVELVRNGEVVTIGKVTRPTYQLNEPELEYISPGPNKDKIRKDRVPGMTRRVWIMGELEYIPIRPAYASTVHKMQGLTVDRVQVYPKDFFFGNPQMCYVALTRCRTAEGLTIVGGEKQLIDKIKSDPILGRWM